MEMSTFMLYTLVLDEDIVKANEGGSIVHTLKATVDKIHKIEEDVLDGDTSGTRVYAGGIPVFSVFTTQVQTLSYNLINAGWKVSIMGANKKIVDIKPGMKLVSGRTLQKDEDLKKLLMMGEFGDGLVFGDSQ